MSDLEDVLPLQNTLGEGPVWSVEEQALYWVDIAEKCFYRLDADTNTYQRVDVGVPIGVLALRAVGGIVMATQKGFAFWNTQKQELEYIADPEADKPDTRFNDGAVDCAGRFWAGTMDTSPAERPIGVLYRLDPDGSLQSMETGVTIANGIGWSPDNTIMYFTDSPRRVIYAYDFDAASGSITNRRTFVHTPDTVSVPDGLAVDAEGYIWSACWDGAKIVRYAPDGTVDSVLQVPALRVTSCVFGGANLDELYITSASIDLTEAQKKHYPLSGHLFRLKTGVKGLKKYRYGG